MHDDVGAHVREDDLREFDAAMRRLYRHGLLSDETMDDMWHRVRGESMELMWLHGMSDDGQ